MVSAVPTPTPTPTALPTAPESIQNTALDDDPLHQLPATSGKISYFASDDGHSGVCDPAAWGELLGENCGTDDATKYWYCAMRWPYVNAPTEAELYEAKAWWHDKKILVTNPTNGKQVVLAAKDWGPAEWTGRVIDVSKTAIDALGALTDDTVNIEFADQSAELGELSTNVDFPFFSQRDLAWSGQKLDNSPYYIHDYGCALTSAAMVSKYFGYDTDPGRLNTALTANGGLDQNGILHWEKVEEASDGKVDWIGRVDWPDWNRIDQELGQGYPVITEVPVGSNQHFVVIHDKIGS